MKWFLPFLGFVFFAELSAKFITHNIQVYYFISMVELCFYSYIFYHLNNKVFFKKLILFFVPLGEIGYAITFLLYGSNYTYFHINLIVSGFFLAAIALLYLYTLVINDKETVITSEPGFWIAAGVSLFFSSASISFSLYDFIVKNDIYLFGLRLHQFIPQALCIVLYLCISMGLLLLKKKSLGHSFSSE